MLLFGQIINESMGAIGKRRGTAPCAVQRDAELQGGTLHPCSPCAPLFLCPFRHHPAGPGSPRQSRKTSSHCVCPPPVFPASGNAARCRLINQFVSRRVRFVCLTIARCKRQPLASPSERLLIKIWKGLFCVLRKQNNS